MAAHGQAPGATGATGGVVVGVDGTGTALRAVGWAAAEARVRGVPLRIVHAAPYATDPAARRRAEAILARAYTVARRGAPGIEAHSALVDDAPVPALAAASRDAGLLVLGMLSGHPGDELVGSVAPAVVAAASCPVTVVRARPGGGPAGTAPVVVGVQGVASDGPAVDQAFADAERYGCDLVVVHADPDPADPGRDPGTAAALHDALAPWRERRPGVPVQVRVVHDTPATALLHASVRARTLVVGTRGRGTAAAVLLGSTSRVLLAHAACPVTVVHRTAGGGRPASAATAGTAGR